MFIGHRFSQISTEKHRYDLNVNTGSIVHFYCSNSPSDK